jgi:acyl-CoA synthetase (AMP-forming)/AMP-acid ligase II
MRLLRPGCFPSLRYSLFCGEALPAAYAQFWQEAAPSSIVENLYGPTETTIAISRYRWDRTRSPEECLHGIVPIGRIFAGQNYLIAGQDGANDSADFPVGVPGELFLSGSQVSLGYWNDGQKTRDRFISVPGRGDSVWYRTGDLVREGADGCLHYLGRTDRQVKIRGYRAELQEVEAVLRNACRTGEVVCEAWPSRDGTTSGVVAFISSDGPIDEDHLLARCRQTLPEYMVPSRIHRCDEMPLNANGKVDRARLLSLLDTPQA